MQNFETDVEHRLIYKKETKGAFQHTIRIFLRKFELGRRYLARKAKTAFFAGLGKKGLTSHLLRMKTSPDIASCRELTVDMLGEMKKDLQASPRRSRPNSRPVSKGNKEVAEPLPRTINTGEGEAAAKTPEIAAKSVQEKNLHAFLGSETPQDCLAFAWDLLIFGHDDELLQQHAPQLFPKLTSHDAEVMMRSLGAASAYTRTIRSHPWPAKRELMESFPEFWNRLLTEAHPLLQDNITLEGTARKHTTEAAVSDLQQQMTKFKRAFEEGKQIRQDSLANSRNPSTKDFLNSDKMQGSRQCFEDILKLKTPDYNALVAPRQAADLFAFLQTIPLSPLLENPGLSRLGPYGRTRALESLTGDKGLSVSEAIERCAQRLSRQAGVHIREIHQLEKQEPKSPDTERQIADAKDALSRVADGQRKIFRMRKAHTQTIHELLNRMSMQKKEKQRILTQTNEKIQKIRGKKDWGDENQEMQTCMSLFFGAAFKSQPRETSM